MIFQPYIPQRKGTIFIFFLLLTRAVTVRIIIQNIQSKVPLLASPSNRVGFSRRLLTMQ